MIICYTYGTLDMLQTFDLDTARKQAEACPATRQGSKQVHAAPCTFRIVAVREMTLSQDEGARAISPGSVTLYPTARLPVTRRTRPCLFSRISRRARRLARRRR